MLLSAHNEYVVLAIAGVGSSELDDFVPEVGQVLQFRTLFGRSRGKVLAVCNTDAGLCVKLEMPKRTNPEVLIWPAKRRLTEEGIGLYRFT